MIYSPLKIETTDIQLSWPILCLLSCSVDLRTWIHCPHWLKTWVAAPIVRLVSESPWDAASFSTFDIKNFKSLYRFFLFLLLKSCDEQCLKGGRFRLGSPWIHKSHIGKTPASGNSKSRGRFLNLAYNTKLCRGIGVSVNVISGVSSILRSKSHFFVNTPWWIAAVHYMWPSLDQRLSFQELPSIEQLFLAAEHWSALKYEYLSPWYPSE
jgi:hypothetical protein